VAPLLNSLQTWLARVVFPLQGEPANIKQKRRVVFLLWCILFYILLTLNQRNSEGKMLFLFCLLVWGGLAFTPRFSVGTTKKSVRNAKSIIWDCDGVLVDSEALLKLAEKEALILAGFSSITVDDCNRMFSGFSPEAGENNFIKEFGVSLPQNFFRDQIADSLELFQKRLEPLTANAVKQLHADRLRTMAVASGSPRNRVDVCLVKAGIVECFDNHIFTREDVPGKGKPMPDIFLKAAASMNVDPSNCIVVEDSSAGIRAALAANMEVIGFLGGGHASPHWYQETIASFNIPLVYSENELYDYLSKR
jgi:HAD superfamily hydrolase (TIGR01509 family)